MLQLRRRTLKAERTPKSGPEMMRCSTPRPDGVGSTEIWFGVEDGWAFLGLVGVCAENKERSGELYAMPLRERDTKV